MPLVGEFIADTAIKNIAKSANEGSKWKLSNLFKNKPKVNYSSPVDGTVDMLWANMHLHNALDPQTLIAQWHKALATDGFCSFD